MHDGVPQGRILLTAEDIAGRVWELAEAVSRDHEGRDLLLVGVLTGAFVFLSDLARALSIPVQVDFLATSSYGNATSSSGVVRILKDLDRDVKGMDVLLVEDIVDTGLTLAYLQSLLRTRGPARLRTCVLLDKTGRRQVPVHLDYCGFTVPDVFLVGYGLDHAERYRQLPYILALEGDQGEATR
ncbi:MAG: hypoxanthine phosphoribosyltransferase [bacterium]|nr:hypoxanthine phosphoribosyltransferase [bacterium]